MCMNEYKINKKVLDNILNAFDYSIERYLYDVLEDSEEDPEFSAVTAQNRIMWYIEIKRNLGESLPYDNVKGYFKENSFEEAEYDLFEKKRLKEAEYYVGEQY